jgi:hypothetical protein
MKKTLYGYMLIAALMLASLGGLNPCPAAAPSSDLVNSLNYAAPQIGSLATLGADLNPNANIIVTGYTKPLQVFDSTTATIATTFAITTPAAKTFTCVAATDLCTATAGLLTGLKGQGSSTTTLPAGLSTSTDYFVIYVSATTFKLATSYANAIAGTAIDITDTGTGTHTFTPTSLAGGTAALQGSIDGTNFFDIASTSQNVTAATTLYWTLTTTPYPFSRVKFVNTAGVETATTYYAKK